MKKELPLYSDRTIALIEGRALRYIGEKRGLSVLGLADKISMWDRILEFFPEYENASPEAPPPITDRIFYTWFKGDTRAGKRKKTVPQPAALDAIAQFLVSKHYLLLEELEDRPDIGLALAFSNILIDKSSIDEHHGWVGEFGSTFSGVAADDEVRVRFTDEFNELCLTAEVFVRKFHPSKRNKLQPYTASHGGWAYPIREDILLVLLEPKSQASQKDVWILKRREDGISFEWLSGHPLNDGIQFDIAADIIKSTEMQCLTSDDKKLYYRHRGSSLGKLSSETELGFKYTYDIVGNEIMDHLLLWCARRDDNDGALYAISRGANVNVVDVRTGSTAFHEAVWHGAMDVIETLMAQEKLDPTILDKAGHLASRGALISLNEPELHVRIKELEERWIEMRRASPTVAPSPSPI